MLKKLSNSRKHDPFQSGVYKIIKLSAEDCQGRKTLCALVKPVNSEKSAQSPLRLFFPIFPGKKVELREGEYVRFNRQHFTYYIGSYIVNHLFTGYTSKKLADLYASEDASKQKLRYRFVNTKTIDTSTEEYVQKEPKSPAPDEILPTHYKHPLPWNCVTFRDGIILLSSPYSMRGGIGKKIVWEQSKPEFEYIKEALALRIKNFIVDIINGALINVYNFDDLTKAIINLSTLRKRPPVTEKKPKAPVLVPTKRAKSMALADIRKMPEAKSSKYISYLCGKHLASFPVYFCVETKTTLSGSEARPEKAFVFILKDTGERMTVIYENTLESRSSYVFTIRLGGFINAINSINQFFASDLENKRESMARGTIRFKDAKVFNYYRIIHNSYFQWRDELNHLIAYAR